MAENGRADDTTIPNTDRLFRRVRENQLVKLEDGSRRPSSALFNDAEMSVNIESLMIQQGRPPEDTLTGYPGEYLTSIIAGDVRAHGLRIVKAAEAAEAKRTAAQKKAEEERRAADEARSASQKAAALAGEFVDIPDGTFQMGRSPGDRERRDDERPVHTVSIKRFRMGKYEVTVGQFRRFVEAAGYRTDAERGGNCWALQADGQWAEQAGRDWRNPGFPQTDRHPVVCVSWNDAEAYVQWLSRQGGGRYRLPSESEWEYAARAGGSARYSFGDSEGMLCVYGNAADRTHQQRFNYTIVASCDDRAFYTAAVGGYRPNRFGLHDMHGNVAEWTEDCYHDSYAGAPSDGAVWSAGDCARRVHRGSSWSAQPRSVRSSSRTGGTTDYRAYFLGFRLLQDR